MTDLANALPSAPSTNVRIVLLVHKAIAIRDGQRMVRRVYLRCARVLRGAHDEAVKTMRMAQSARAFLAGAERSRKDIAYALRTMRASLV